MAERRPAVASLDPGADPGADPTIAAAAGIQPSPGQAASRKGPHWSCIEGCGACCRLDPDLRQDALAALSVEQRQTYLALVGPDGWCLHFDTGRRRCRIYDERPDFCRVSNLLSLFAPGMEGGEEPDRWPVEAHQLAVACCEQQIRSEYGGRGRVMRRFQRATRRP
jgi:Fe-S-cluster containining protein